MSQGLHLVRLSCIRISVSGLGHAAEAHTSPGRPAAILMVRPACIMSPILDSQEVPLGGAILGGCHYVQD